MAYFWGFYFIAEMLAIPATPLTISAGYLFGGKVGSAVVLSSAIPAASAAFWIGRSLGRDFFLQQISKFPKLKLVDRAVGEAKEDAFKLILFLRLSPLLPFSLSNYFYGLTSVEFLPYFWGTLLGFLPGTAAFVFSGEVGGEFLSLGGGGASAGGVGAAAAAAGDSNVPLLAVAVGCLGLVVKVVGDIAGNYITGLEGEEVSRGGE